MHYLRKYIVHIIISLASLYVINRLFDATRYTPDTLTVIIRARVLHNDIFQIFYLRPGMNGFSEDESIQVPVTGSPQFQEIRYDIPFAFSPQLIRFDLGRQLQEPSGEIIGVKDISLSNSKHEIKLSLDSIQFASGVTVESDRLITFPVNGNYDPYFYSQDIQEEVRQLHQPIQSIPLVRMLVVAFWLTFTFFTFQYLPPFTNNTSSVEIAFLVVCFAVLCAPVTAMLVTDTSTNLTQEKRAATPLPKFAFSKDFARQFSKYFDDNFGFRSELINLGARIKVSLFNTFPNPEYAMMGKDGFMFYNASHGADQIFESYTHTNLLSPESLDRYVHEMIEQKQACEEIDAVLIKGFWPNAQTIYPEKIALAMKLQIRDTISKADQILNYIKDNNIDINFIDVRPALLSAKKEYPVYFRTDSHWNDYGALVGVTDLLYQLSRELNFKPRPLSDYEIKLEERAEGDLLDMIGIGKDQGITELAPKVYLKNPVTYVLESTTGLPDRTIVTSCEDCEDQREVLIFRDSFGTNVVPYFSTQFKKVTYVWTDYQQSIVGQLNPDIVIHIPIERYL